MPKAQSQVKTFVKQTARQTWSTALLVAFLLGGVALTVSSFSGPPAGCTPASCPANPLRVDFTNGIVNAKKLQLNDQVVPGSACSSTGLVATNTEGELLSCQSGSWKKNGLSSLALFTTRTISASSAPTCSNFSVTTSCAADEIVTGCNGIISGKSCTLSGSASCDSVYPVPGSFQVTAVCARAN